VKGDRPNSPAFARRGCWLRSIEHVCDPHPPPNAITFAFDSPLGSMLEFSLRHDSCMRTDDPAWKFNWSEEFEKSLKPLCERIESHFRFPAKRLCRYFATSDDSYLRQMCGEHFRGFHVPRSACPTLPPYLVHSFYRPFDPFKCDVPFEETIAFDNLIYIRESTCREGGLGFALTYAHELQHFVQQGDTPTHSAVNSALYQNLKQFEPDTIATSIPHEREANIVSKRIAEMLFGTDAVAEYAQNQIQFMEQVGDAEQKARWVFFRDVPSSTVYNLLAETIPFVEKYRNVIDFGVDTEKPQWWAADHPVRVTTPHSPERE